MRNYPEWPIAFIAITAIGAVAVPMNSLWKSKELKYGLKDSGAKVVICDEQRYGYMSSSIKELGIVAIGVRTSVTPLNFERIVIDYRNTRMPLCHDLRTDDVGAIFYTSGTTGFPKGKCMICCARNTRFTNRTHTHTHTYRCRTNTSRYQQSIVHCTGCGPYSIDCSTTRNGATVYDMSGT